MQASSKPIKIYAEILEDEALRQFQSAMSMPFSIQGALMADAHVGYSLPIGGVIATQDVIVPAWVGYDIGCGMCAAQLDVGTKGFDFKKIFTQIYRQIPVGFAQYSDKQQVPSLPHTSVVAQGLEHKGYYQLGTLGGGNHFIEIGEGRDKKLWIVIHSGSRNLGHFVASHYMRLAHNFSFNLEDIAHDFENRNLDFKKHNPQGFAEAQKKYLQKYREKNAKVKNTEGHYPLAAESQEGRDYILDMNYCLEYALQNRKIMLDKIKNILGNPPELMFINRNHNHAEFDGKLWIHRKGATQAHKDMLGVIPGNMRDGSFIVKGRGNPDSLFSSSHGAGRVLGRKQAKERLSLEVFKKQMRGKFAKVEDSTLDESPSAYKNIFEVMELQKDLVEVIDHVSPLVNIKG